MQLSLYPSRLAGGTRERELSSLVLLLCQQARAICAVHAAEIACGDALVTLDSRLLADARRERNLALAGLRRSLYRHAEAFVGVDKETAMAAVMLAIDGLVAAVLRRWAAEVGEAPLSPAAPGALPDHTFELECFLEPCIQRLRQDIAPAEVPCAPPCGGAVRHDDLPR